MLELRYLKHVIALSQFKNFRKAAEAVNISQPALTKSIQKVETILGVKLFERNSDQIKITKYGNFVLNNAHSIVNNVDKISGGIANLKTGAEGMFRIGMHSYYFSFLAEAVQEMLKTQSNLSFDFIMLGHREAVSAVLEKNIDFYVGMISNDYALQHTELRFKPFPISEMVYVVNAKHPLSHKKRVLDKDVLQYDWVALDNRSTIVYKRWLMEALSLKSYDEIEKRIKVFVPNYTIIKNLLIQFNYIAIIPKVLVEEEIRSNLLAVIKPEWKIPHIRVHGYMMHLETYSVPPYMDKFMAGLSKKKG